MTSLSVQRNRIRFRWVRLFAVISSSTQFTGIIVASDELKTCEHVPNVSPRETELTDWGTPDSGIEIGSLRLVILTILLAASAIVLSEYPEHFGRLGPDSTQYLVGAISILNDAEYSTRILYFDEHYSYGAVPAPQTVWPPGVSFSIAALASLGLSPEVGGRILSSSCYVALAVFTGLAVWYLTKYVMAMLIASVWLLSISPVWHYSVQAGSDMVFAATVSAAVLMYVANRCPDGQPYMKTGISFRALAWISLIAGVSFLFRYAGVFLIVWAILLIGSEFVYRIRSDSEDHGLLFAKSLGAALPSVVIFMSVIGRNLYITGGIRGGNNMIVSGSISDSILNAAKSVAIILTGVDQTHFFEVSWLRAGIGAGSLAVLFTIGLSSLLWFWNRFVSSRTTEWRFPTSVMIVLLIIIYVGGIVAISSRTVVTIDNRYIFPIVPAIVILGVSLWSYRRSMIIVGIAIISITQILAGNSVIKSHEYRSQQGYAEISEWIKRNTSEEEPILVIGDSQRIGYYSDRPTLGVPRERYTSHEWNLSRIAGVAGQYGARHVIASRTDESHHFNAESSLLMEGNAPNWLTLQVILDTAYIYRITENH